ncbi:hypothetical protein RPALISO_151 [Ruegeria phage RpAliso]|nr:hypothetical protein RPALISO_151 [Ruegeria phage RpAliso]
MDHKSFHAIVSPAVKALDDWDDPTGVAAVITAGDTLYSSIDWDNWELNQHKVLGMLWALRIEKPTLLTQDIKSSKTWRTAVKILGDTNAVEDIAARVWPAFGN